MAIFNVTGFSQAQAPATMEYLVRRLVALRPRIGAVLRAGSLGCCYALTKEIPPGSVNDVHLAKPPCVPVYWVPAFWTPEQAGYQGSVVDPTGAGNAFCGGLMAALSMGQSLADGESLPGETDSKRSYTPTSLHHSSSSSMACPA